jgi:exosortase E/protease (VPEID-CTERM system)
MPLVRLLGLAALLIVEVLVLVARFSTESLAAAGNQWWAETIWRWKVVLPPLAIAVSTASVLFGGDRLRVELRRVSADLAKPHRMWPWLVAHLVAFAAFAELTAFILEGGFAHSTIQPLWVTLWLVAAAATTFFWAASACPPDVLLAVLWRARGLLVVGVVVGTMGWGAGLITEGWWDPLREATMNVVAAMVHMMAADAVFVPEELIVGTQRFWVRIASTCAGYEGIGLIWVFTSAYIVMCRDQLRFPRALLLIPIGTVVVWIANAFRLTALIAIGTWIDGDIAMGGFHAYSGSLLFSAVSLALVFAARRSRFFAAPESRPATDAPAATDTNASAAYLLPFLAIVATQMFAGAVSTGTSLVDVLYPLRIVAAGAVLFAFRHAYRGIRWTVSWEAVACGLAVFVLWMALEPTPDADKTAAFVSALHELSPGMMALWLVARVIGSVVTVPIAEELAFRGYLQRRLIDADFERVSLRTFTWVSFVVASMLFGVMHGRWLAGTLAGMCFALVVYRRGELSDAIAAHALTNAMIAAYVLATGHWLLW